MDNGVEKRFLIDNKWSSVFKVKVKFQHLQTKEDLIYCLENFITRIYHGSKGRPLNANERSRMEEKKKRCQAKK